MEINSLDDLDFQILDILMQDSRTSYLDVARKCNVSGSTIHVRINKMEKLGIIKGAHLVLNNPKLGFDVCCFIGIKLDSTTSINFAVNELSSINEVVELHCTTGNYSIFIKVICKTISELQDILINKIQKAYGVINTDIYISLIQPVERCTKLY